MNVGITQNGIKWPNDGKEGIPFSKMCFFLTAAAATFPWASPHISKHSETSALVGKMRFKHKKRLAHSPLPTRDTTHLPALQSPDFPLPSFLGSEHTSYTRTCISTPKQKSTASGPILVDRAETDSSLHVTTRGRTPEAGLICSRRLRKLFGEAKERTLSTSLPSGAGF